MNPSRRAFEVAAVICDATDGFCRRFLRPRSPTRGRMARAVRLCRQAVAEAEETARAAQSPEAKGPEPRQVKAVRAGLGVLLIAYEEHLRQSGTVQWGKDEARTLEVRAVGRQRGTRAPARPDAGLYARWLEHEDVAVVANATICLIHQANHLLSRQSSGYRYRFGNDSGSDEEAEPPTGPECPACGRPMLLRVARRGVLSGSRFWGCSGFPDCRKTMPCTDPGPGKS